MKRWEGRVWPRDWGAKGKNAGSWANSLEVPLPACWNIPPNTAASCMQRPLPLSTGATEMTQTWPCPRGACSLLGQTDSITGDPERLALWGWEERARGRGRSRSPQEKAVTSGLSVAGQSEGTTVAQGQSHRRQQHVEWEGAPGTCQSGLCGVCLEGMGWAAMWGGPAGPEGGQGGTDRETGQSFPGSPSAPTAQKDRKEGGRCAGAGQALPGRLRTAALRQAGRLLPLPIVLQSWHPVAIATLGLPALASVAGGWVDSHLQACWTEAVWVVGRRLGPPAPCSGGVPGAPFLVASGSRSRRPRSKVSA